MVVDCRLIAAVELVSWLVHLEHGSSTHLHRLFDVRTTSSPLRGPATINIFGEHSELNLHTMTVPSCLLFICRLLTLGPPHSALDRL